MTRLIFGIEVILHTSWYLWFIQILWMHFTWFMIYSIFQYDFYFLQVSPRLQELYTLYINCRSLHWGQKLHVNCTAPLNEMNFKNLALECRSRPCDQKSWLGYISNPRPPTQYTDWTPQNYKSFENSLVHCFDTRSSLLSFTSFGQT